LPLRSRERSPDLAEVNDAWPTLPDEVKVQVLALVRGAVDDKAT
jgi:hypothetical protein